MIDNFDSFTYNLVDYFRSIGESVIVKRNNEVSIEEIEALNPDHIVISPGPCSPDEAGISLEVVKRFKTTTPILGVCLGFQVIAQEFGHKVEQAERIMHGKTSLMSHDGKGLFSQLENPLRVTRYHSLCVDFDKLGKEFKATAWVDFEKDSKKTVRELMAFQHDSLPLYGVQFHPESVLTECGHEMLKNFISLH